MENSKFQIGNKLKSARLASGLTQEKVAELIGLSSRYVGSIETDRTR